MATTFKDTSDSDKTLFNSSAALTLGMGDNETGYQLNGYLDEVRISSVCRYPGGALFAPPTTAFASDSDTVLLLHGDGSNGGTTFTDSSSNNYTLSVTGNTHTDTAVKKIGTASIQFDGTGDYLSLADNSNLNFANNPFTVEFWVYFNSVGSGVYVNPMGQGQESANTSCWYLHIDPTNVKFRYSEDGTNTTQLAYSQTLSASTWYHFAITRDDTVGDQKIYVYQDGVSKVSGAVGHTVTASGDTTNKRVYPVRPGARSAAHVIGPQQGNSSVMYFAGEETYLEIPDSADWNFGSNDFTIEMWVNMPDVGFQQNDELATIISQANTTSLYTALYWVTNSNSYNSKGFNFYAKTGGGGELFNFATGVEGIKNYEWNHVAVVRNGTSWKIYVNGIERASRTGSDTLVDWSYPLRLGTLWHSSGPYREWKGYLDEVRISNVARYTAAFTPPTEQFVTDANTKLLIHGDGRMGTNSFRDSTPGLAFVPSADISVEYLVVGGCLLYTSPSPRDS